jgi:hypothetical protein
VKGTSLFVIRGVFEFRSTPNLVCYVFLIHLWGMLVAACLWRLFWVVFKPEQVAAFHYNAINYLGYGKLVASNHWTSLPFLGRITVNCLLSSETHHKITSHNQPPILFSQNKSAPAKRIG